MLLYGYTCGPALPQLSPVSRSHSHSHSMLVHCLTAAATAAVDLAPLRGECARNLQSFRVCCWQTLHAQLHACQCIIAAAAAAVPVAVLLLLYSGDVRLS